MIYTNGAATQLTQITNVYNMSASAPKKVKLKRAHILRNFSSSPTAHNDTPQNIPLKQEPTETTTTAQASVKKIKLNRNIPKVLYKPIARNECAQGDKLGEQAPDSDNNNQICQNDLTTETCEITHETPQVPGHKHDQTKPRENTALNVAREIDKSPVDTLQLPTNDKPNQVSENVPEKLLESETSNSTVQENECIEPLEEPSNMPSSSSVVMGTAEKIDYVEDNTVSSTTSIKEHAHDEHPGVKLVIKSSQYEPYRPTCPAPPIPKLKIKPLPSPSEDSSSSVDLEPTNQPIKLILKPVETTPPIKITIRVDGEKEEKKEMAHPKIIIKPIVKPQEMNATRGDDSQESSKKVCPKITIKPLVAPCESESMSSSMDTDTDSMDSSIQKTAPLKLTIKLNENERESIPIMRIRTISPETAAIVDNDCVRKKTMDNSPNELPSPSERHAKLIIRKDTETGNSVAIFKAEPGQNDAQINDANVTRLNDLRPRSNPVRSRDILRKTRKLKAQRKRGRPATKKIETIASLKKQSLIRRLLSAKDKSIAATNQLKNINSDTQATNLNCKNLTQTEPNLLEAKHTQDIDTSAKDKNAVLKAIFHTAVKEPEPSSFRRVELALADLGITMTKVAQSDPITDENREQFTDASPICIESSSDDELTEVTSSNQAENRNDCEISPKQMTDADGVDENEMMEMPGKILNDEIDDSGDVDLIQEGIRSVSVESVKDPLADIGDNSVIQSGDEEEENCAAAEGLSASLKRILDQRPDQQTATKHFKSDFINLSNLSSDIIIERVLPQTSDKVLSTSLQKCAVLSLADIESTNSSDDVRVVETVDESPAPRKRGRPRKVKIERTPKPVPDSSCSIDANPSTNTPITHDFDVAGTKKDEPTELEEDTEFPSTPKSCESATPRGGRGRRGRGARQTPQHVRKNGKFTRGDESKLNKCNVFVEEDTRMSADHTALSSVESQILNKPPLMITTAAEMCDESRSSSTTENSQPPGSALKRSRGKREAHLFDGAHSFTGPSSIAEYSWANEGPFMLQEQVAQYLGVKSFKRKYPNITRRTVDMQERDFLRDNGLAGERLCDMGLTAVLSSEILDIMFGDFPDKYEELRKYQRDKQAKEILNKQRAFSLAVKKGDAVGMAVQSAHHFNQSLNKARREQRMNFMDLQTFTVMYPQRARKSIGKSQMGDYPIALLPGQFVDSFRRYTSQELKYLPVNSVLCSATIANDQYEQRLKYEHIERETSSSSSSSSGSDESDSCDSSSDDSSDVESVNGNVEQICKLCATNPTKTKPTKPDVLIKCADCGAGVHASCADLTENMMAHVARYKWQCTDCKTCSQCYGPLDHDKMVFCDKCDRAYHNACVNVKAVLNTRWHCQRCL